MRYAFGRKFFNVAAVVVAAGLAAVASAQVRNVEPYTVTVFDKAELRCADMPQAYRVAEVAKGATLTVDGEGQGVLRVAYPSGALAFAKAEDGTYDEATKTLTLTKGSKLRAAHLRSNLEFNASWKTLLENELPAGTALKVTEVVKGVDGVAVAYKVDAPSTARAFVNIKNVRKPDGTEIKIGAVPTTSSTSTKTGGGASVPFSTTAAPSNATTPTGVTSDGTTTTDASSTTTTTTKRVVIENVRPKRDPVQERHDNLEAAFRAVRTQPVGEAEIAPLLTEYQNALLDLPADSRRRPQLQQRIDFLKVQQDLQDNARKLTEITRQVDERTRNIQIAVSDVERTRVYTIIGMLMPSTVYDGTNLPLMYRIQSVGAVGQRTLGYLKPEGDLNVKDKVGLIVGVIGEASIDPVLQLNIVKPVRVDALRPSTAGTTLEVVTTPTTTTTTVTTTSITSGPAAGAPVAIPAKSPETNPAPVPAPAKPNNDGFEPVKVLDPEK
ncbi:MAG: hypothetical protein KGS45_11340 [Planctomycetes bacterium]|nr:hypothetical protein [Planctomycetota bacterium]